MSRRVFTFDSRLSVLDPAISHGFTDADIAREPMVFACDLIHAERLGGPITRMFIESLPEWVWGKNPIIDTRAQMLMPGWWPGIPGWHHDDIPRDREDGQPDYDNMRYQANHAMMLINGGICPTQFITDALVLPDVPLGRVIYRDWHPIVQALVDTGNVKMREAPSDRILVFNHESMHQAQGAKADGWRWFGRATWNTDRPFANTTRTQVQIYLEKPMAGW